MTRAFLITSKGGIQFIASIRDGAFFRYQPGVGFITCKPMPLDTIEEFLGIKDGGMRVCLREDKEAMNFCIRSLSPAELDLIVAAVTDMHHSIYSNFADAYTATTNTMVYPPCSYIKDLNTKIMLLCHYFENEVRTPITNILAQLPPELAQTYMFVKQELTLLTPDFDYTPREGFPISLSTMLLHYAEMRYIYNEGNLAESKHSELMGIMKTIEAGVPCVSRIINDAYTADICSCTSVSADSNSDKE